MGRRQVLDDDEGRPAVGGHGGEETLEGFQGAGRPAQADHRDARRGADRLRRVLLGPLRLTRQVTAACARRLRSSVARASCPCSPPRPRRRVRWTGFAAYASLLSWNPYLHSVPFASVLCEQNRRTKGRKQEDGASLTGRTQSRSVALPPYVIASPARPPAETPKPSPKETKKCEKKGQVELARFLLLFSSSFVFFGSMLSPSFGLSCQKNKMLRLCSAAKQSPMPGIGIASSLRSSQ